MAQSIVVYKHQNYALSYEVIGLEKEEKILILHGWGANKELMINAFSHHLKDFCQIYVDLPGFGRSSVEEVLESEDYALIVGEFLKMKGWEIAYFMGHSFGGKICALLARKTSNAFLILLSSAGIIAPKSFKVRFKIALFKFLKKLGFGSFYRFFASKDGANLSPLMYETFKKVVDEDFSAIFKSLENQSLIFWGEEDQATPLKSGELINTLIKKSTFYPLKGDHFFFLQNAKFIADTIKKAKNAS
ncbi:alpha/beta hydrolase [Campylobacter felis]|uniref:Alpha/beta hydrolase n=1 Tax=Campylobacter felis TaxID=2974565 RepID=A0ABT7I374_9BACT|nr:MULTISPECIES: alpha/beta hydrolase [Campylobacter]MDL0103329.1 alpha/beta hydrolase [Campylobacter felis]MDL0108218.1 alpha/beta hydrolase [Campylobacter felis]MDL0109783.1 alpha/beta hydrolase [Campylobacter felis]MDL0146755.1 alpha/beta hydrolase [Campylobacter felis]